MRPVDQDRRDRLVADFTTNYLVEAGAGTGKTTLLVERTVRAIVDLGVEPEQLVLITFMEKAAAEIVQRLEQELAERVGRPDGGVGAERAAQALSRLASAKITTIHGFCLAILREFALAARVPVRFEILDAYETDRLWRETFTRWLRDTPASYRVVQDLLGYGLTMGQLETLARQAGTRDAWPDLKVPPPDLEGFIRRHGPEAEELAARAEQWASPEDRGRQQMVAIRNRFRLLGQLPAEDWPRLLLHWRPKLSARGNRSNWTVPEGLADQKAWVAELADELETIRQAYADYVAGRWLALMQDSFLPFWRKTRWEAMSLTFDDLLWETRDVLRRRPDVADILADRFRLIMVDEFQDTDSIQAEIVFRVAGGGAAPDWRETRVPPGKLFLVGDPKQSIYRFRGADVETYSAVRARFEAGAGQVVPIVQNFRSEAPIIDWVNRVFEERWPRSADPDRPYVSRYEPLVAARPADGRVRVMRDGDGPAAGADERRAREAGLAADLIEQAIRERWPVRDGTGVRPIGYGDMVLIMPARTGYAIFQQVLAARGIPLSAKSGVAFFQQDEIRGFQALLAALRDPDDEVNTVAWLTSPWVGMTSRDLAAYRAAGGTFSTRADIVELPPVADWLRELKAWRRDYWAQSPADTLEHVLQRTGLGEILAARGDAAALANLTKLADLCRDLGGRWGQAEFTRWLRDKVANNDREEEGPIRGRLQAVEVSTVHQSKGLEWPLVIVCNWGPLSTAPASGILSETGKTALSVGPLQSSLWHLLRQEYAVRQAAENERLLYVALTRARDYLMVCDAGDPDGGLGLGGVPGAVSLADVGPANQGAAPAAPLPGDVAAPRRVNPWVPIGLSARPARPSSEAVGAGAAELAQGTAFHRCLEQYFKTGRRPVVCDHEEPEVRRWVARAVAHPFFADLAPYPVYPEVPVLSGAARGVIDLVVDHPSGLWIVDYKTERPGSKPLATAARRHAGQLRWYQELLAQATGRPVTALWIYFAVPGTPVRIR